MHAHPCALGQSKREARHLRCILPGNMPAEKEDKQWEEGERVEGRRVMNSRLRCYGNVQGRARACTDHIVCLFFLPPLSLNNNPYGACKWLRCAFTRTSDRRVAACNGVLGTARCCSEHYVICFVQALHQNFLSATTEVQTSGQPHIRTPSLRSQGDKSDTTIQTCRTKGDRRATVGHLLV